MNRVPTYRRHKPTGQARVTLGGKDFYLGKYGTRESRDAYQRLIGEYIAGQGRAPGTGRMTLVELCAAYKKFAKSYYIGRDGKPSDWYAFIKDVLQKLGTSAYGRGPAVSFGPLALKAYRDAIVRAGGSRKTINMKIDIVKRAFKWAAGEELIPASAYESLRVVEGLKKGRSQARETAPVLPIDDERVEATLPHLPEIVADMVRLQRLTGMRPAEVCLMRPVDIDTVGDVWIYKPLYHKTEHHGRERTIFIGPQAQAILRPYLLRAESSNCFVPAESERRRRALQHAARATVPTYGNRPGTNVKRKPKWAAGQSYCTDSYRRAITRGCEVAFGMPDELTKEQRKAWRVVHAWAPNQLRHTAATQIRRQFGLEAAQITLGHTRADVTQIYAERDLGKAADIMRQVG
jgi:integrase